jgi:hypothetical protein
MTGRFPRADSRAADFRGVGLRAVVFRAVVFRAADAARAGRREDFAAVLGLRALPRPLAALLALAVLADLRVRAIAAVFVRAALFLPLFRVPDFARGRAFFVVTAALRLAIGVVLSAAGLP